MTVAACNLQQNNNNNQINYRCNLIVFYTGIYMYMFSLCLFPLGIISHHINDKINN